MKQNHINEENFNGKNPICFFITPDKKTNAGGNVAIQITHISSGVA